MDNLALQQHDLAVLEQQLADAKLENISLVSTSLELKTTVDSLRAGSTVVSRGTTLFQHISSQSWPSTSPRETATRWRSRKLTKARSAG